MDGNKRRQAIIDILKNSLQPVSGTYLAKTLQVSRQVIVQDIALLRAGDYDIYSTHKGYVLNTQKVCKRIFKVHHDDNEVEKELSLIVDLGGYVEDVFVYHKVYNIVKATLNIASRRDIKNYMTNLQTGHSSLLKMSHQDIIIIQFMQTMKKFSMKFKKNFKKLDFLHSYKNMNLLIFGKINKIKSVNSCVVH